MVFKWFLLVGIILILVFIPFIGSDEPVEQPILWKRTATTNIYKNNDGTYTRTIGQGIINLDDESRNIPNYMPRNEFFRIVDKGYQDNTGFIYNISDNKKFINVYDKDGNYMSSFGFAITGIINSQAYKVSSLDYDWTWSSNINSTEAYFEGDNNNIFHWIQKYHLYPDKSMKIENYVENNIADISNGKFWYIQTVNRNDSVVWNRNIYSLSSSHHLQGNYDNILPNVEFPDYYVFDYSDLIENGFNITDIYIGDGDVVGADGEWILAVGVTKNNGNFPKGAEVTLDPTITLQDADTENLDDTMVRESSPSTTFGSSTFFVVADTSSYSDRTYMRFNISSLNTFDIYDVTKSNLTLSIWTGGTNTGNAYLYNTSSNFWTEGTLTWNTKVAGDTLIDNVSIPAHPSGQTNFDILNMTKNSILSTEGNLSIVINSLETHSGWGGVSWWTKEYATTSLRPKLTITYTPYIDIVTPTPSQIFTDDEPIGYFNVTTVVNMTECYWSPDTGVTNYSMSNITDSTTWTLLNNTMEDGSYANTKFYCNQSSDGAWRTSDTVDFEVDSVNVTVCRDLTVADRKYQIQNNIDGSGIGIGVGCLLLSGTDIDNVIIEGNDYTMTGVGDGSGFKSLADDNFTLRNLTIDNFGRGMYPATSDNCLIEYMTFTNCGGRCIDLNFMDGCIIRDSTTDGTARFYDLTIGGDNHNVTDCVFVGDVSVGTGDTNNIFLNVTYNSEDVSCSPGLIRKWYFQTQVNTSSGYLANAQVDIYDKDGNLEFSELTDATGNIPRKELIEYVNNGGTKTYNTPHTINVSKATYTTNTTIYNITAENNIYHYVTLSASNTAPTVTLSTPENNSYSSSLTNSMVCNSTDTDGNLDNATIYTWLNGVEESNNKKDITGSANETTWTNFAFTSQGAYEWNCYVCDNNNSCSWASSNFTLNIDAIDPSATLNTPANNTNTTTTEQNMTVNLTDVYGIKNTTLYIYNETGLYNETTETFISGLTDIVFGIVHDFVDGIYNWWYKVWDWAGNSATSANYTLGIDSTAPIVTIDHPIDGDSYTHTNISMNFTITDNLGLDSCWYSNDSGLNNYTITGNFTQNLSDGSYTYIIYANDSMNNLGEDSTTFTISTIAPAINLNTPSHNQWFNNGTNIYFNFTATDADGLCTCQLWGDWTGTWHKNYTWFYPTNATMNSTTQNITEGTYKYNIWCNDTNDNNDWGAINKTFSVDETYPDVIHSHHTPAIVYNNNNAIIFGNISDTNLATVQIEINYTGAYQNITVTNKVGDQYNYTILSTYIDNFENISWRWWANDSVNLNSSILSSLEVANRNPYAVTITNPSNNSFINTDWIWVNFSSTDTDGDTINYTLYNSTDEITFLLYNSTTGSFLNFTGFDTTDATVFYLYVTANDTELQNVSNNYTFTIDTTYPTISIDYPEISPTAQCSMTNIELNYSIAETNINYCEFNVTYGGLISSAHAIISDCSNTTFNVSYDNSVQQLNFNVIDKAGNSNSTSILIYIDTDNAICPSPPTPPSVGGGTTEEEEELPLEEIRANICGNGLCELGENFYNCPVDCGGLNLDDLILSCFSEVESEKSKCIITQAPVLFYIGLFVIALIFISIFTKTEKGKKYKQKILYAIKKKPREKRRKKSWLKKYVK